eukprot:TRINITY_DN10255_c0_g2_i3.p2 TRINITY_DN10255_c0_g2~~TRINITY_DN10255_c0_g2_i3.p2  ORF type:complete len:201 (+),score=17.28 TRINITY_DN10255_c0_g2_i3:142-744(+)
MLDKLPVDLLQHWILSNLTAEDCANLSLVNKGLHQAVKSMLPWKPALRWHQQLLTGEWERLWKNVFVTQTPIHDNQLIYYLQHFPMNITRFQQTFVKAARCNCVQALQLVWSLWQGQQEPNDHLLTLTVQVRLVEKAGLRVSSRSNPGSDRSTAKHTNGLLSLDLRIPLESTSLALKSLSDVYARAIGGRQACMCGWQLG